MPSDMRTCLWVGLGVSATVGLGGFLAYRAYNSFVRGGEIQVEPSMDGEEAEADTGFKEEAADAPVKLTPIEEEEEEEEEEEGDGWMYRIPEEEYDEEDEDEDEDEEDEEDDPPLMRHVMHQVCTYAYRATFVYIRALFYQELYLFILQTFLTNIYNFLQGLH